MNERSLITLGLLLAAASRKGPKQKLAELHGRARELQAREPMTAALGTVLAGATAFYWAERGKNPKIESYYDALIYASTNISVGYSDILAKTPLGKLVGSLLMTYGPALAARAFDAPGPAGAGSDAGSNDALRLVAAKLDAILMELKARRSVAP